MSFPRYPKYKPSGVEWLSEVPEHWAVLQIKRIARLQSGDSIPADSIREHGMYPVFGGNGLRGYTDGFTHEGAFVLIGRQGALCGNVNYAHERFWASEHAVVAHPVVPLETRWLGELLRAMNLNQYSTSAAQPGLAVEAIAALRTVMPPFSEQRAIAAFLDRETAKIDALIAEQEKLIELLAEKRQAVISHAVTKGLNPAAPMKPSGVEWLGDVPAHWTVRKIGHVSTSRCDGPFGSGLKSEHYSESGARVVRLQNIKSGWFSDDDRAFVSAQYAAELAGHEVMPGDLLVAGLGDENNLVGRACVAPEFLGDAMVKADCFRFRLDPHCASPKFVAAVLCVSAEHDAGNLGTGSTRTRIPLSVMASRRIPLPSHAEQLAISAFLDRETANFDALVGEAERGIELLRERRSALISAAVTGQIDVRNVVPETAA